MSKPKKVAIYTGNRAEYGLQSPVIRAVSRHPGLAPYLLVSGAHLDPEFGSTAREILEDGVPVYREIAVVPAGDDLGATVAAIGHGIINMRSALADLDPDWMLVYGDRFESFAALIASTQLRIPTAHIEGGDRTEGGALDDSVRHAMTKLAHLHFTTNSQAAERILRLGEEPWRIHNVGLPTLDLIADDCFTKAEDVSERYRIGARQPVLLFTQHSIATEFELALAQLAPALAVLQRASREGVRVIITYANNDAGGRAINQHLKRFASTANENVSLHASLGRRDYHGLLALIARSNGGACIGNSSSGIKETPAFGCPAIDIGSRQDGRLYAANLIRVGYDEPAIHAAVRRALTDSEFIQRCKTCTNPYGNGDAGRRIADVIAHAAFGRDLVCKKMTY